MLEVDVWPLSEVPTNGSVAWVGLYSLCPFLEQHLHAPEPDTVQRGTVENWTALSGGTIISTTIPGPQLAEEYQLDPPRFLPWSYTQSARPDETCS
jgi:hypothetical protein